MGVGCPDGPVVDLEHCSGWSQGFKSWYGDFYFLEEQSAENAL